MTNQESLLAKILEKLDNFNTLGTIEAGSPGGDDNEVQYNDNGEFAGSPNLTFDGSTLSASSLRISALGQDDTQDNILVSDASGNISFRAASSLGGGSPTLPPDLTPTNIFSYGVTYSSDRNVITLNSTGYNVIASSYISLFYSSPATLNLNSSTILSSRIEPGVVGNTVEFGFRNTLIGISGAVVVNLNGTSNSTALSSSGVVITNSNRIVTAGSRNNFINDSLDSFIGASRNPSLNSSSHVGIIASINASITNGNYSAIIGGNNISLSLDNTVAMPNVIIGAGSGLRPSSLTIRTIPTFADDASAGAGGLTVGDVFKTVTGELRIKL